MSQSRKRLGGTGWVPSTVLLVFTTIAAAIEASASTPAIRLYRAPEGMGSTQDRTGSLVALLDDSAVVVSRSARTALGQEKGALAFYRQIGGVWQREAIVVPSGTAGTLDPSYSIALAHNLAVAAVEQSPNPPVVHTYAWSGTTWTQVDQFALADGIGAATPWGTTLVALSGDTLVAGGNVYLRSGNGWQLQASLQIESGEHVISVAVDGDLIAAVTKMNVFPFSQSYYTAFYARQASVWTREQRMHASDDTAPSVAISGQTALVGADNAVVAYVRDSGTWAEQGRLDPLAVLPSFGTSVALQGDRAIVGSPGDAVFSISGAGTAYVFQRSGGIWLRSDHVADLAVDYVSEEFGTSVALSGDHFLVGAPGESTESGWMAGAGHMFELQGANWNETAALDFGNSHAYDAFGSALAASSGWLAVGAPSAPTGTGGFDAGAVDLYQQGGNGWSWQTRIWPPDGYHGQGFGSAIAISESTLVIGAGLNSSVAVYDASNGAWPLSATIAPIDGDEDHQFGSAVALSGDILAIGDPRRLSSGTTNPYGTVELFEHVGSSWTPLSTIAAIDHTQGDSFGYALALTDGTLAVGAPSANIGIEAGAGAVYVYVANGPSWDLQAKIVAPLSTTGGSFGRSVALAGDTLLVGKGSAPYGAAYIYRRDAGVWSLEKILDAPHSPSSSFGASVALTAMGTLALVGAPPTTDQEAGTAFAFALDGADWSLASTWQAPGLQPGDRFGFVVAFSGEDGVMGAPAYQTSGSAFIAPLGNAIFSDGFDEP